MSQHAGLSAVLYARDLDRVAAFYAAVLGVDPPARDGRHVVLRAGDVQLVVLAVPEPLAREIVVADPPVRRTETPIKLMIPVDSIARVRDVAGRLGGVVDPPRHEWTFQGDRVCDGHDPEGNVFQLREPVG